MVAWVSGEDDTLVGGSAKSAADDLVRLAKDDLAKGRYAECLRKLDDATRYYPPVAEKSDVKETRAKALAGLGGDAGAGGSR
jgi:hypothetical protein